MKLFASIFFPFIIFPAFNQQEFTINETGLAPSASTQEFEAVSKGGLYQKTLTWIEENRTPFKLVVEEQIEQEAISLSSTKWNAVYKDEAYYIVQYTITLKFQENGYTFEPTAIRLKLNSKYDMGWQDFDHSNTSAYFKKGKLIKKYKNYIPPMTDHLNELSLSLNNYLSN